MKSPIKILSWNVNGIRAVLRKGTFEPFIKKYKPDILCLQETKAQKGQAEIDLSEYEEYWNSAEKKGYAGTAIFSKHKPISVIYDMPRINADLTDSYGNTLNEGRVLTLEFKNFFVTTVYTPNSKPDLSRKMFRHDTWDPAFIKFVRVLEKKKPVIFCGDLNVAHKEIDLARPKQNTNNAGFTQEERAGANQIVKAGFVDTFRSFHQDQTDAYTWWSHFANARQRNIGWRIDYVFVSASLIKHVSSATIHPDIMGSDHCPIGITLKL